MDIVKLKDNFEDYKNNSGGIVLLIQLFPILDQMLVEKWKIVSTLIFIIIFKLFQIIIC